MKKIEYTRNIGVMAHVDAGKTTLTERMLYYTGLIHKLGNVDDSNTTMDTDAQEKARGITISSAAISTQWSYNSGNYKLNIIDTPGHIDFVIEVERSLRVLDGAVAVFCAASGVEPQSENVWRQATKFRIPRICFINKMDRQGADFLSVVSDIKDKLGASPLALQYPIGSQDEFCGVIDLLEMKAIYWKNSDGSEMEFKKIPENCLDEVLRLREQLLEVASNADDEVMELYLSEKPIPLELLNRAIRRATVNLEITPVLCGSAYKNKGVQPLLDAVVNYLPHPENQEKVRATAVDDAELEISRKEEATFTALVFKVVVDRFLGKLGMARIYSGSLSSGGSVLNSRTGKTVRISRLLELKSNDYSSLERVRAGDICAVVGVKDLKTGDTLCHTEELVYLESIEIPEPVISVAVEPKTSLDQEQLGVCLNKMTTEDPSFRYSIDEQTGQTILSGMGELHLEVRLESLRAEYGLSLTRGKPKVSYRECVTSTVEFRERLVNQSGGSGQFADISFIMSPAESNEPGLEFSSKIKGGVLSKEHIDAVEKGFTQAMNAGFLGGFPLESLKVELVDGAFHANDSSPLDFERAAKFGFRNASALAEPRLLEPIMNVEIQVPEEYLGAVNGNINKRRGWTKLLEEFSPGVKTVHAEVPLAETFGYIGDLRTLTSGRGTLSMVLSHYALVPAGIAEEIL